MIPRDGPREKTPGPHHLFSCLTIYFPSSPLNQTHSKKFSFSFSLQSFPSTLFHLQTNTPLKETNINHPKGHDYAEWVRITRPISSYEDGSGNAQLGKCHTEASFSEHPLAKRRTQKDEFLQSTSFPTVEAAQ